MNRDGAALLEKKLISATPIRWQSIENRNVEEQNVERTISKKKHGRVKMSKG
jgi:hypothetical protein